MERSNGHCMFSKVNFASAFYRTHIAIRIPQSANGVDYINWCVSVSLQSLQQQKRQLNATRWTVTSTKSSIAMPSLLLFIYPINCNANNRLSMRNRCACITFECASSATFYGRRNAKQYLPIYRISKFTRIASSSIRLRYVATWASSATSYES